MPEDEDALRSEGVFVVDDLLGGHSAVVANLSPHVVDEEWLSEHVLVVRVRHGLEVEGHGGTAVDIANLVAASGRVHVSVEEAGGWGAVLWEEWVVEALIELLVIVDHVVAGWAEEATDLLVGEEGIEEVDLVDGWLLALVTDAGEGEERGKREVDFPDWSIAEHVEREGGVADKSTCPSIVRSVQTLANLVQVVASSLSPLPVVIAEEVV